MRNELSSSKRWAWDYHSLRIRTEVETTANEPGPYEIYNRTWRAQAYAWARRLLFGPDSLQTLWLCLFGRDLAGVRWWKALFPVSQEERDGYRKGHDLENMFMAIGKGVEE